MARSKLALVHVRDACDGPWSRVNGMRSARVEVTDLGPGEAVRIEFEEPTPAGLQLGVLPLDSGVQDIMMQNWRRYRVCKSVPDGIGTRYTTVEIFPNG